MAIVIAVKDAAFSQSAESRDRAGDLQIFSLMLTHLSYRGHVHMCIIVMLSPHVFLINHVLDLGSLNTA